MPASTSTAVLFRTTAGPRRGFGHLVRCTSLARALKVPQQVSLRAGKAARETARALGWRVIEGGPRRALETAKCDLLIVDDPVTSQARDWMTTARETGRPVASVHDLGIGALESDLVIDGSAVRAPALRACTAPVLAGPDYAILDPAIVGWRRKRPRTGSLNVLIALGGGPHATLAASIARALVEADSQIHVRIAAGFTPGGNEQIRLIPRVAWLGRSGGLAREMARADIVVVGGGVTLYEACAVGVAAVAIPVVDAQRETIAAFIERGAATGIVTGPVRVGRVARLVLELARNANRRSKLGRVATALVDGQGAARVARAVTRLVSVRH